MRIQKQSFLFLVFFTFLGVVDSYALTTTHYSVHDSLKRVLLPRIENEHIYDAYQLVYRTLKSASQASKFRFLAQGILAISHEKGNEKLRVCTQLALASDAIQNQYPLEGIDRIFDQAWNEYSKINFCDAILCLRLKAEARMIKPYLKPSEADEILKLCFKSAETSKCYGTQIEILLGEWSKLDLLQFNVSEAVKKALWAIQIADQHKPGSNQQAFAYSEAAKMFFHSGNYPAAEKYWFNSLKLYKQLNESNPNDFIRLYNDLGQVYEKTNRLNAAEKYFTFALNLAKKEKSDVWISIITGNLGDFYLGKGELEKALPLLIFDAEQSMKNNEYESSLISLVQISELYFKKNQVQKADSILKFTEIYCDKSERIRAHKEPLIYFKIRLSIAKLQSQLNAKKGLYASAFNYLNQYSLLSDSIHRYQLREQVEKEISKIKLEKQVLKNRELRLVYQNSQKQIRISNLIAYYSLTTIGLLIIILIVIIKSRRRQRIKAEELEASNQKILEAQQELQNLMFQLRETNEALLQTNALKDKLFSLVAHDLRAPLNSFQGIVEDFHSRLAQEDELQPWVNLIEAQLSDKRNMLDNLLRWSKAQLQGVSPQKKWLNLKATIEPAFYFYHTLAESKGITLENRVESSISFLVDEEMLQLVIRNLLHNAIKFSNPGDLVWIDATALSDRIMIQIADTGIGMKEEQIQKLFQLDNASTRGTANEPGTGLGLLLCKDFVEANQGTIVCHSELGKGTVFTICFSQKEVN